MRRGFFLSSQSVLGPIVRRIKNCKQFLSRFGELNPKYCVPEKRKHKQLYFLVFQTSKANVKKMAMLPFESN